MASRRSRTHKRRREELRKRREAKLEKLKYTPPPSGTCPFLDKLPAEIRVSIYELVFDPRKGQRKLNDQGDISIFRSTPPPKDLLLTCRKVFLEASKTYTTSYRNFWTNSTFLIDRKLEHFTNTDAKKLRDPAFANITSAKLIIRRLSRHNPSSEFTHQLIDSRGIWALSRTETPTQRLFIVATRPASEYIPTWEIANGFDEAVQMLEAFVEGGGHFVSAEQQIWHLARVCLHV